MKGKNIEFGTTQMNYVSKNITKVKFMEFLKDKDSFYKFL